jgi:hypothetical protein
VTTKRERELAVVRDGGLIESIDSERNQQQKKNIITKNQRKPLLLLIDGGSFSHIVDPLSLSCVCVYTYVCYISK